MSATMMTYLGFAFTLILVFLIVRNADAFKRVAGALGAANVGAIVAFQGGNPGKFVNS